MHRAPCLLLLLLVLLPAPLLADTDAVAGALRTLDDARQDQRWHFTMRLLHNGELRVVRHDPGRPEVEQRTLLAVDGAPPEPDELRDFRKSEQQRIKDKDPEASYLQLVDLATLKTAGTENGLAAYAFSPRIKALEKSRAQLRGVLLFNTDTGAVEKIELTSAAPFSPAFSVTLDSYRLTFLFRDEQGARLLDRMESVAAGRAGFVKAFEDRVEVAFADYRPDDTVTAAVTE